MTVNVEQYSPLVIAQGLNTTKNIVTTGSVTAASITSTAAVTAPTVRPTSSSALVGATVVLTAADSGKVLINRSTSGSPSWTLPAAADGLYFTFLVSNTTAGFTVTGGTIFARASATGASVTGTTLTNTQGTAVIGDTVTLVCNGTDWRAIAQMGIFAAA